MPLGSSLLSLHAGITRLTNKVCLAQRRQTAKGRDYSVMALEVVAGNEARRYNNPGRSAQPATRSLLTSLMPITCVNYLAPHALAV